MPASRSQGMDQDFYPWSPIVTRPILRWPNNARVALAVIVNLEHWDWEVPANTPLPVSPMGGPEGLWTGNPPDNNFPDIGGYGNHEYGNRVGIFRVLAVLDRAFCPHLPVHVDQPRTVVAEENVGDQQSDGVGAAIDGGDPPRAGRRPIARALIGRIVHGRAAPSPAPDRRP